MKRLRHPRSGLVILLASAGLASCGAEPPPAAAVGEPAAFTMRIARDGALFLDGKPIARRDLAREFVRLADRVRVDARIAGKPIEPGGVLPASIVYQADGETPFAAVLDLTGDAQSAGFRRWGFALDPAATGPGGMPSVGPGPALVPRQGNGDLPAELRTLPIRLHADGRGAAVRPALADREFPDLESLRVELASILDEPGNSFDRATLTVDPGLHFAELVRAVELIARFHIGTIDLRLADPG
jgi:biopolymer transport protein ExbD